VTGFQPIKYDDDDDYLTSGKNIPRLWKISAEAALERTCQNSSVSLFRQRPLPQRRFTSMRNAKRNSGRGQRLAATLLGLTSHPGQLSLAIPPLVGAKSEEEQRKGSEVSSYLRRKWRVLRDNRHVTRGPIFEKSYDNLRIFVQYTLILRQIYDITTIVRTLLTL